MTSLCDNSNPNAATAEKLYGFSAAGLFGYSHIFGGYAGGKAQYVRVPFADVGPLRIPEQVTDEQALFLTDIFPPGTWPPKTATSSLSCKFFEGCVSNKREVISK